MPPKKKCAYQNYDTKKLPLALEAIRDNKMTIRKASQSFNIPKSTLHRHLHGKCSTQIGHPTTFSVEEENRLIDAACILSNHGLPPNRMDFRKIARALLASLGRKTHFPGNLPTTDWLRKFLKRRKEQLSLRVPECLGLNRAKALNDGVIKTFFSMYKKILDENPSSNRPSNIWNCDETGFGTDPKSGKVLAKKGSRLVNMVTGSVLRQNYTVLACGNACGNVIPPLILFKGKHLYSNWCKDGPEGALYETTPNGWIDEKSFCSWLEKLFIPYAKSIDPIGKHILILDGHVSHCSLPAIYKCMDNNIELICLPPHATHVLQPLDVAIFKPVKDAWRSILADFYNSTGFESVDKVHFPRLLKMLYGKSFNKEQFISGFRTTGLYPLDVNEPLSKIQNLAAIFGEKELEADKMSDTVDTGTSIDDTSSAFNESLNSSLAMQPTLSESSFEKSVISFLSDKFCKKKTDKNRGTRVVRKYGEALTSAEVVSRLKAKAQKKKNTKSKSSRQQVDQEFECSSCKKYWDEDVSDEWVECDGCGDWICEACLPENFDTGGEFYCEKCVTHVDIVA